MNTSISTLEIPLNEVKPFILANVKLQCERPQTARMSIIGSPGCGKSDILRQVCEENGWGLAVKYLSNMSMEQITGIPCRVEAGSGAQWTKPELFNFDNLDYKPEGYEPGKSVTILLIDDFHLADKIIQKYLFQLLTYKSLNGYRLPENTAIIMAGNKITDKALAHSIPAPVMNRISVYEVKADKDDWIKNFAFKHGVRHDILTFLEQHPAYLVQTPIESTPWASPRSWTFLSEQMDAYEKLYRSIPIEKLNLIASGLIGKEYTAEFITYREIFSKWDWRSLRAMPDKELFKKIKSDIEDNAINAYGLINSGFAWMLDVWSKNNYNCNDKEVKETTDFVYKVQSTILTMKCKNVQVKPMVIAGLDYLYKFQDSLSNFKFSEQLSNCRKAFLKNIMRQAPSDWLFYEIIANVFSIDLTDDDKENIKKAKAEFHV